MGVTMEEGLDNDANAGIFALITEIDPENSGIIRYQDFKPRIVAMEVQKLKADDETELLDAYVAMGGEADGGGCVDAKKTDLNHQTRVLDELDIEKLIEEIDEDGSGEI